ncbi:MAG: L,D-transpeptidase family protein [Candidatus Electrothrix sp. YB6]
MDHESGYRMQGISAPIPAGMISGIQKELVWILKNNPAVRVGFAAPQDASVPSVRLNSFLLNLYMEYSFYPFWVTEHGPGRKAHIFVSVLRRAGEEGLNPEDYRTAALIDLLRTSDVRSLATLDIMLTLALHAYLSDILEGRVFRSRPIPDWFFAARTREASLPKMIRQALNIYDLLAFLNQLSPGYTEYHLLKKLLAEYRQLATKGGWPAVPPGTTLRPGMQDSRLAVLAERLFITGDLQDFSVIPPPPGIAALRPAFPEPLSDRVIAAQLVRPPCMRRSPVLTPSRPVYGRTLLRAVKHFQRRYNLNPDGAVGKKTLEALNLPVQEHIDRILLNLERWRWLPNNAEGRRILVNIAGFRLTGRKDDQVEIEMPVVVGKVKHKTPVFSHTMTYIEVNPYWNIPKTIARNEIAVKVQENSDYLQKERIRVFDGWQEGAPEIPPASIDWATIGEELDQFRLRQEPGPENALGTIKFMFPNNKNIYMHDTPSRNLFRRIRRAYSHGCIRLARPLELARYILSHDQQPVTGQQLHQLIDSKKRKIFILNHPLPVHIMYWTVRVDRRTGTAYFYDDIYGCDARLGSVLFAGRDRRRYP